MKGLSTMCLGVPGQILTIDARPDGLDMARVSFGGIVKEVCLAYTPEAQVGDYVVVHVGFAISRIDEAEAQELFRFLEQMQELDEIHTPQPDAGITP